MVISIPIIPDNDNEFNESFKLTIEVSGEARASSVTEGGNSMAVVLIKDDVGMLKAILPAMVYYHYCISFANLSGWLCMP